jgi:hypothetical protein
LKRFRYFPTGKKELGWYASGGERLLFGVVTFGLLDVVHLWIQKSRGFEGGCSGLETMGEDPGASSGAVLDCAAVTSGPGSELFRVSNIF